MTWNGHGNFIRATGLRHGTNRTRLANALRNLGIGYCFADRDFP
jgi:hypothetical protein